MGFLANDVISIDAILTKKGREEMAKGTFRITQFALSDDEIDYTLYNPTHPSGSAFYGEAIEKMPIIEAFPDETQIMKYKLLTLPRGTSKLPVINVGLSSVVLKQGASIVLNPQTLNYLGAVSTFEPSGYVVTIADGRLVSNFVGIGIDTSNLDTSNLQKSAGTNISISQIGTSFTIAATTINTLFGSSLTSLTTQITVVGRDSGARITIPLTINKNQ